MVDPDRFLRLVDAFFPVSVSSFNEDDDVIEEKDAFEDCDAVDEADVDLDKDSMSIASERDVDSTLRFGARIGGNGTPVKAVVAIEGGGKR